jgi:adenosylcobyric acid synthase
MARALMMLGTHSHAGKSAMATAFCRILARRGFSVAPFKAQNMSNNAGVTSAGGEMGRSQIAQAEAAGIEPHTDMNPVLLKPEADRRSQVILHGRVHGHIDASNWRDLKRTLWSGVRESYERLSSAYDLIIMEGAGSPAEINLKSMDMVNLAMARHADAPCILVGDIDRGGVFAALAGTMLLLEPDEREQIKAFLINRFRGDPDLLGDAVEVLQRRAFGVPCLGIVPFLPYLGLAAEDGVRLDEGDDSEGDITCRIAVIQLPHIANFDEFEILTAEPGVQLSYVRDSDALGRPDAVILPGTKATLADLNWLRERQLDRAILHAHRNGSQVVGICGGYQMLGHSVSDPEGVEGRRGGQADGLGLLPVATRFLSRKETHQVCLRKHSDGLLLRGYEIHIGETLPVGEDNAPARVASQPLTRAEEQRMSPVVFGTVIERDGRPAQIDDGAVSQDGRVWGTYVHGLFAHAQFRRHWLLALGWRESAPGAGGNRLDAQGVYDRLADAVEDAVGWPAIADLMRLS